MDLPDDGRFLDEGLSSSDDSSSVASASDSSSEDACFIFFFPFLLLPAAADVLLEDPGASSTEADALREARRDVDLPRGADFLE